MVFDVFLSMWYFTYFMSNPIASSLCDTKQTAVHIHQSKSEEIGNALIENVITKYSVPEYIIMDQDNAIMSSLMNYLFKKLDIKIKLVVPYNHQSSQAEHGIKSLSTILMKHLTSLGQMWPKYVPLTTFA